MDYHAKIMYYYGMTLPSLKINNVLVTHCGPDWNWICHANLLRDYDLWFISAGRGRVVAPTGAYECGSGDCFIYRPGNEYCAEHDPKHPLSVTAVHFDFLDARRKPLHLPEEKLPPFFLHIRDVKFVESLMQRVITAATRNIVSAEARMWFTAVLCEMTQQAEPSREDGEHFRRIEDICKQITTMPWKHYRLRDLAGKFGCSVDHFSRVFRQCKGISPGEFMVQNRIQAAQTLLRTSSHSVHRISELLGYNDPFFFGKQFRERVGMSPGRYRSG